MALDFKKMSFGQLAGVGAGLFVLVMIIAGFVISSTSKPPQKTSMKRPAQFESPPAVSGVELEQLRNELVQLKARIDANAQAAQDAFTKTAATVDQQNANISAIHSNVQVAENRLAHLENQRVGTRVHVVKPEDQHARPLRSERLASSSRNAHGARPVHLAGDGDYKVQATVGNRAWIRNGDEEISVREGEVIPLQGNLVVKRVTSSGQVSVDVENTH